MTHPTPRGRPARPNVPLLSRRDFTRWMGVATLGSPLLASCGSGTATDEASLKIGTPGKPVTWSISDDNQPIADAMDPEKNATLKIYTYADYISPDFLAAFEEKYADANVTTEVTTFNDYPEALAKLRSGQVDFDVFFVAPDSMGKVITAGLLRPLNQSYIPNITNVWPDFTNPFYDGGWRYTVPYTVYTTGIAWRTDMVEDDIAALENPWDVFWDPKYKGMLTVLDDYRETLGMALLRNGITDINTIDQGQIDQAKDDLLKMTQETSPKVTINYYSELPEGQHGMSLAWSGDAINFQYYAPEGSDLSIYRYWYPGGDQGRVDNDMATIVRAGKNPVLAHLLLNELLSPEGALQNFSQTGYQPPQNTLTPDEVVKQEFVGADLDTAVTKQEFFADGLRILELQPDDDAKWQGAWQQFKGGA